MAYIRTSPFPDNGAFVPTYDPSQMAVGGYQSPYPNPFAALEERRRAQAMPYTPTAPSAAQSGQATPYVPTAASPAQGTAPSMGSQMQAAFGQRFPILGAMGQGMRDWASANPQQLQALGAAGSAGLLAGSQAQGTRQARNMAMLGAMGGAYQQAMQPPESAEPTDDIREYQYAVQNGFDGSFADWMAGRTPQTTITVGGDNEYGSIPSGYTRVPDKESETGYRLVAEPGGEPAQELERYEAGVEAERVMSLARSQIVVDDLQRALEMIESDPFWTTGWVGGKLSELGGTSANNLRALLDSIRSSIGIERIIEMKEASPTGATGFGQLNLAELNLLLAQMGSLDQTQNAEQLQRSLNRIFELYTGILEDLRTEHLAAGGELPDFMEVGPAETQQQTGNPLPQTGDTRTYQGQSYRFLGGDPNAQANWELVQ